MPHAHEAQRLAIGVLVEVDVPEGRRQADKAACREVDAPDDEMEGILDGWFECKRGGGGGGRGEEATS